MSLFEQFKSRPVVVQRLTFVWTLLAFYPVAMMLSSALFIGGLDAYGVGVCLFLSALLLALAWGHFRERKSAWCFGVFLSIFGLVGGVASLPSIWVTMSAMYRYQARFNSPALMAAQRASLASAEGWRNVAVVDTCIIAPALLLMLAACVLALSRSGRAAYGIGRQSA